MYHFVVMKMAMTADNSPSRSRVNAGIALPAMPRPEVEEAAAYARAEKSEATRRACRSISLSVSNI